MDTEKIIRVFNKWNKLERQTRHYGTDIAFHPSEIHTIELIGNNPGLNISQIAEHMGIELPSTSVMINKLKKKGLVLKYLLENNKKEKLVRLTPKGQEAFEGHKKFHDNWDAGDRFLQNYPDQDKLQALDDFFDFLDNMYSEMLQNPNDMK